MNVLDEIKNISIQFDEVSREYELNLTNLVNHYMKDIKVDELENVIDGNTEEEYRYAVFYSLVIYYRLNKNYTYLGRLLEKYKEFENHKTFYHLKGLYLIKQIGNENDKCRELLNLVYIGCQKFFDNTGKVHIDCKSFLTDAGEQNVNCQNLSDNAGHIHLLADAVASTFKASENFTEYERNIWMEIGMKAVEKAIRLDSSYAKYYCTKARLHSLNKEYKDAIKNINTAIDFEDCDREDYAIRISSYQFYRLQIESKRQTEKLREEMAIYKEEARKLKQDMKETFEKYEDKLNSNLTKNIEILSLFTAIISFVIIDGNILSNSEFKDAVKLTFILMGLCLCVYAGAAFSMRELKKETLKSIGGTFAVGIFIIAGGMILCQFI